MVFSPLIEAQDIVNVHEFILKKFLQENIIIDRWA
jgi:hypothetical protein